MWVSFFDVNKNVKPEAILPNFTVQQEDGLIHFAWKRSACLEKSNEHDLRRKPYSHRGQA